MKTDGDLMALTEGFKELKIVIIEKCADFFSQRRKDKLKPQNVWKNL